MKSLLCVLGTFVCIASAGADDFSGPRLGEPTVAPAPFPGTAAPMPVPRAGFEVQPAASYTVPMPPAPTVEASQIDSTYSPALPEGTYESMTIESAPVPADPAFCLYQNVRVVHPHQIADCAVPTIIQVPDPCNPCCCVYIEVCFPQCRCPQVSVGPLGRRVWFDFGRDSVVVTSRANGVITVNYN